MRPHLRNSVLAAVLAITALPALAQGAESAATEASRRLNQLFQEHAVAFRPLFPLSASANGWRAYDNQFANWLTEEHREAQRQRCRQSLASLQAFDRGQLGENDGLSYDVFRYNLETCLERLELDLHLIPVDQVGSSLPATFPVFGSGRGAHPFRNVRDYENFLKRVPGFVEWMDTAIANMRRGMERGFTQPRAVMEKVLPQLAAMIVEDATQSPFYQPIVNMPAEIKGDDRERLTVLYGSAIRDRIVPAYRRVHDFVRDEYLPRSRTTSGLAGLPGGDRLYGYLLRARTTTRLTPEEISDLGYREMGRVRQQLEALKKAAGVEGDLKAWAAKLRGGRPRYATDEEVIAAYEALHERVHPLLENLFGRLPRTRYVVRRLEPHREDSAPSQYWRGGPGRPAVFYVNMRGLQRGPIGVSVALFLHEALPGHHLQIALQQENTSLPSFRRGGNFSAFSEGWAVYAELLGLELGLYEDPFQHLAMLNTNLSRAVRLVVDVGLHAKGWSREDAVKFILDNTLDRHLYPDVDRGVARQVERIMAWPAQGLAYKIGQLKFSELRARAEKALGAKFDLRTFHDELLKDGALPLDILEAKMDRWIASQLAAARR